MQNKLSTSLPTIFTKGQPKFTQFIFFIETCTRTRNLKMISKMHCCKGYKTNIVNVTKIHAVQIATNQCCRDYVKN